MITTYESFEELAECMCMGEGVLHALNCVDNHKGFISDGDGNCIAWQQGVQCFAEWLDHIGVKVNISDQQEDFYDFMSKKYKTKIEDIK